MDLETVLRQKQSSILKNWFELVIESYAGDTGQFLRRQKDPIANPVGGSIREGLDGLFGGLVEAFRNRGAAGPMLDREALWPFMDRIVRIRALQDFKPSASLAFIPGLKAVLRKAVGRQAEGADLAALESLVDDLLFLGFDVYAACREDLFNIRVKDEQRRIHLLLRRAKLIGEKEGEEIELPDLRPGGPRTNDQER
ncbi:MAG: RsbRD N-terminal domain-containing protein [Thermodesulfobacteriota bacterium]